MRYSIGLDYRYHKAEYIPVNQFLLEYARRDFDYSIRVGFVG
jgi:hypothetical protein